MSKNTEIHTLNLAGADELNIVKTFECGQCFRWNADENGIYTGVAFGYPARVWTENGRVYLRSAAPDELWREYFDLDRDYAAATRSFDGGEYLAQCVEFGRTDGRRCARLSSPSATTSRASRASLSACAPCSGTS